MPATGGRRGRRDNGLVADKYEAAGDVDPRIGEHLLDVLAAGGIAAYLQPSTDQHPITRTTSLPARPTDRLFVDREHLSTARGYIDQVTAVPDQGAAADDGPADGPREPRPRGEPAKPRDPGRRRAAAESDEPDDTAVDTAWRQIVAGFHVAVDHTDPPWPTSEEVTLSEPRPLPTIDPRATRRADPGEPSLLDALDTFGATLPDDDDEGYTPPPPPPLPRISRPAALAMVAIAFGLLLFIWPDLLPLSRETVLLIAFGSVVAGFATLIWRLRPDSGEDDDYDDGARV